MAGCRTSPATSAVKFFCICLMSALFLLTFQPGRAAALSDDEKASRAFKFAKGLFDMQKYSQAAAELQKFISFYEKSRYAEYALYLLGESLYKTEDYKGAREKYSAFLNKYKESRLTEEVYYSMAYTELSLGDKEAAYGYFQKLYKSEKKELSRDAVFKCARHLAEKKDAEGAKKAFADYFALAGEAPLSLGEDETLRYKEALFISGNISLRAKNEKEAMDFYERFLKLFSNDPMAGPVYYNIGELLYARGQYKKAAENYALAESNIDKFSQSPEGADYSSYIPKIHYSLGWCHYSLNDYRPAAEYFEKCFNGRAKFENRADCGLRLGISLFNLKKFDRAAQIFKEVRKIGGISEKIAAETDYYLGMALQKSGLLSEAYERFSSLASATSEIGVDAAYVSAVILFDQKKYDQAIARFRDFLSRFPSSSKAQHASFNIGLAYFNLAKYKEAREALLEFNANYKASSYLVRSYFNLGEISIIEKKYEDAISWFTKIPQTDSMWLEAELKICDAYFALKDLNQLTERYRKIIAAVESVPSEADYIVPALFKIGKNLSALCKYDLAVKAYEKIIAVSKSERNSMDAKFKIAVILFETGGFDKCAQLCQQLLGQKDIGAGAYSVYEVKELSGRAACALKKFDEAMKIFDEILASEGVAEHIRHQARFGRATVYNEKKDFQKAIESFEQLALDVQDVEMLARVHYLLAAAYEGANNSEEAVKNLLKIEILYKDTTIVHDARLKLLEIYVKTKQRKDAKNLKAEIMKSSAPKSVKDKANELTKK